MMTTTKSSSNNNTNNNHKWMEVSMASAMKEATIQQSTTHDIADIVRSFERDMQESDRALEETLLFAESLLAGETIYQDDQAAEQVPMVEQANHCWNTSSTLNASGNSKLEEEDYDNGYNSTDDMSDLTGDDIFYDDMTKTTLAHSPGPHEKDDCVATAQEQQTMISVPTSLAVDIVKFCDDCPITLISTTSTTSSHSTGSSSCCSTARVPVACLLEALQVLVDERDEFIEETLELMHSSRRTVTMALTTMAIDDIFSSNKLLYKSRQASGVQGLV